MEAWVVGLWKRIEHGVLQAPPSALGITDECVYAREYIIRGKYNASEANQLVFNLKISPQHPNYPNRKWHKINAANQFATELSQLLPKNYAIASIPTSKVVSDPEYDPRFEMVFKRLRQLRPDLRIVMPLEIVESHKASHLGGDRGRGKFYESLRCVGLDDSIEELALIDDVITSGWHFKDCQRKLLEDTGVAKVTGVFWAIAVELNVTAIFDDLTKLLE